MALRSRNAVTLFKIEVTPGVDAAPVAASDAVEIENFRLSPNVNQIVTAEDNGSLDGAGAIAGGMTVGFSFDCLLKGSAAAGTAPQWGKIARACAWSELITATAVPAAPEALAAGGSTTLAILGTSGSATAAAYDGMPINFTSAVTLQTFISLYAAAKNATITETASGALIATSNYQIPVNVRYGQLSAPVPSVTVYRYQDGKLWKILGCRGSMGITLDAGGIGRLSFRMTGIASSPFESDAAVPVSPTLDATRPPSWVGGKMRFNRLAYGVSRLSIDGGVATTYPPNPEASEGVDVPEAVARRITGSMDLNAVLVGTADLMTDMRAGTKRILHARAGTVAGNRWGLTVPEALMLNNEPGDRGGIQIANIPFECVGRDRGAFLTIY